MSVRPAKTQISLSFLLLLFLLANLDFIYACILSVSLCAYIWLKQLLKWLFYSGRGRFKNEIESQPTSNGQKLRGGLRPLFGYRIALKKPSFISHNWTASSEFGTYRLCEQRRFWRACASAQSRQNLRCSLIQAVSQGEPPDRKLDPWPLWMAGHAQLKFVMTECSKTQICLTRPNSLVQR